MNTQEQRVHFIGPFMKRYEEHIRIRAKLGRPILFVGASGTGKRQAALIVADELNKKGLANVNCPGISYSLIMSDLFGHEKGSFTGAWQEHIGKAERASINSEVLYLDEIAEMDPDARAIFLNALQELKASRVGGNESFPITCPIVATAMDESKMPDALLARFYKIYLPPLKLRYDYDGRNYTIDSLHLIGAILKNEIEGLQNQIELGVTHVETKMLDDICGSDMPDNIRGLSSFVIEDAINAKHGKASRYKWRFKDSPPQDGVETGHELIPIEEINSYAPEALKSVAPPLFFNRDVEIGKKELITAWKSIISGEVQDGRNKGISALILKREGIIPWAKGDDSFLYSQNLSVILELPHDWLQQYRKELLWGIPLPEVLKVCEIIVKYAMLYRGSRAYEESEFRILNAVGPWAYNRFTSSLGTDLHRQIKTIIKEEWMAGGSDLEQRAATRIKNIFQEKGIGADGGKADLKLAHKSTGETKDTLVEVQKQHIITVLREEKTSQQSGYIKRAAERLGIPRSSLYQKIKENDLTEFGKISHRRGSEKRLKG